VKPWILVLACSLPLVAANAREAVNDRMQFYTQWDDDYLYFAAHCDDVNVVGKRDGLAQPVYLDDEIEVFLQTDSEATPKLTSNCWWLAMSVAQGVVFRQGDGRGNGDVWSPAEPRLLGARFRQAIRVQGTLNDPTDVDQGWVVEAAIPWRAMGRGKPESNEAWGFNVVRHLRGETDGRYSYIFKATPPETQVQPLTWGRIVFRAGAAGEAWIDPGDTSRVVCPRALPATGDDRNPLIDGYIGSREWPLLHRTDLWLDPERIFPMDAERFPPPAEVVQPLPEGCSFEAPEIPARARRERWFGERYVLSGYRLDYQDDPRQPGGPRSVRAADGSLALALQPAGGLGPWFSGLRVDWHRDQLLEAAGIGIDHLLVNWDGDAADRKSYADAALASLVTAAAELRTAGKHVPALAPLLTTKAIAAAAGPGLDLTQPVAQASLWRSLRAFYERVPSSLRADVLDGPRRSLLVGLGASPEGLRASDSFVAALEEYSRQQFERDLVWIGSASWGRRPVGIDAVMSLDAGLLPAAIEGRRLTCASVGPGYDDTRSAAKPEYRGRRGIRTFREGLVGVLEAKPGWLWLQSFNDYEHGDALAETVEYRQASQQAARVGALQFNAPNDQAWVARLRQVALPLQLAAGKPLHVPLVVRNAGLRDWQTNDAVQLAYRWYNAAPEPALNSDGTPALDAVGKPILRHRLVAETSQRSGTLAAASGGSMTTAITVTPQNDAGQALPPGRYRLRFDLSYRVGETEQEVLDADGKPVKDDQGKVVTRKVRQERWFSFEGDSQHEAEVEVVAPNALAAVAGTILEAGLPGRLATGGVYRLAATLRNDGSTTWDAGVRLAARFERRSPGGDPCLAEAAPAALTPWMVQTGVVENLNRQRREAIERVGGDPSKAPVINNVAPGELAELRLDLRLADEQGRPLPLAPGDLIVNLALVDAAGRLLTGGASWRQVIELVADDPGVVFETVTVPELLRGGQPAEASVTVANRSTKTWPAGTRWLTWRWYTWDGLEKADHSAPVPFSTEVKPGTTQTIKVKLDPPREVGLYRVMFEVSLPDGTWARQQPSMRVGEVAPRQALVVRGETRPVDLSEHYNARIASFESETGDVKLDDLGRSLPAERMPPFGDDAGSGLYPSGYLQGTGPDQMVQRQIAFWLRPARTDATAIQPAGQLIAVVSGRFRRLHVLAFATADNVKLALRARLTGTPNAIELPPAVVGRWTSPPLSGTRLGYMTPFLHDLDGPAPGEHGYLHHVTVNLDPSKDIDALILPPEPRLRILAMTLEEVPVAVGPPAPGR